LWANVEKYVAHISILKISFFKYVPVRKNIRMDLRKTGWEGADWMHQLRNRDEWKAPACMIMNLQVP
jgi:hypothetical protein